MCYTLSFHIHSVEIVYINDVVFVNNIVKCKIEIFFSYVTELAFLEFLGFQPTRWYIFISWYNFMFSFAGGCLAAAKNDGKIMFWLIGWGLPFVKWATQNVVRIRAWKPNYFHFNFLLTADDKSINGLYLRAFKMNCHSVQMPVQQDRSRLGKKTILIRI